MSEEKRLTYEEIKAERDAYKAENHLPEKMNNYSNLMSQGSLF